MYSYPRGWTLNPRLLALCVSMVLVAVLFSAYTLTAHADPDHPTGELEVKKVFVNAPQGTDASTFSFTYDKQGSTPPVTVAFNAEGDVTQEVETGAYDVTEANTPDNYTVTYSSNQNGHANNCDNLSVGDDQNEDNHGAVICTITNTYHAPEEVDLCSNVEGIQTSTTGYDVDGTICTPTEQGEKSCTIVSSVTTTEDGHTSSLLTYIHQAWTAVVGGGAAWIWGSDPDIADVSFDDSTQTFTKTFTLTELPSGDATLRVAADNTFTVTLNGTLVVADPSTGSFAAGTEKDIIIPGGDFAVGENNLVFTVTNLPINQPWNVNPAGLDYKLTFTGASCVEAIDQCGNLDGFQTHVPEGYTSNSDHFCAPIEHPSCTIVSDNTTQVDSHDAVALTFVHPSWTNLLDTFGAKWIWSEDGVSDPVNDTTKVFTKVVHVGAAPSSAVIDFTVDNGYQLRVNGTLVPGTDLINVEHNYEGTTTVNVLPYLVANSDNTIEFTVHNLAEPAPQTVETNPAGLDYVIHIVDSSCTDPHSATIVATKIVCDDESDLPNLQGASHATDATTAANFLANHPKCHLQKDWQFEWGNENAGYPGGGSFVGIAGLVNGYNLSSMTASNGTVTITVPNVDTISSLHFREVLKDGFIPFSDDNNNTVSAELSCTGDGLNYDNWEWMNSPQAGATYYCVAFNAPKTSVVDETKHADLTITKTSDVKENTANVEQQVTYTPTAHNNGPDNATGVVVTDVLPDDVVYISQSDGTVYDLATGKWTIGDLANGESTSTQITVQVKVVAAGNEVVNTASIAGNQNDNGDGKNDSSTSFDVPNEAVLTIIKNTTGGDGTFTFHLLGTGQTNFDDSTDIKTDNNTGEQNIIIGPGTYNLTENSQIGWDFKDAHCVYDDQSVGSVITNGEALQIEAGDHVTCTFDNEKVIVHTDVVVTQCSDWLDNDHNGVTDKQDGACHTDGNPQNDASYDPTIDNESTPGTHHSGGGGGKVTHFTGQVLGASCGLYMDKHLRLGSGKNDVDQTKKLQDFLNRHFNAGLPVSGFFGKLTDGAVKKFQGQYGDQILKPWGIGAPTGLVYFTTLHQINAIECPDAAGDVPGSLIDWSKNKNAQ